MTHNLSSLHHHHKQSYKSMKRYAVHLLLLFFILSSTVHSADSAFHLPQNQSEALQSLSTNLPTTSSPGRTWNTTDPNPCLWPGVTCSRGPTSLLTGLSLSDLGLAAGNSSAAAFFRLLCQFESLQSLDLSRNFFTSLVLSGCTGLPGLKSLNLSSNRLTGPLPILSVFPALKSLDLSYNLFNGSVDSQLDGLHQLESLNLSFNLLAGAIPTRGVAPGLQDLVLSHNQFRGQIPDEISRFGNLSILDLGQNSLSGSVPDGIGGLSKLEMLLLSSNNLNGTIPGELSKIKTLSRFAANQNRFTGTIPIEITRYVRILDLSYNRLSGVIPPDLLSPPTLESVDLTSNLIGGQIPRNLSKMLYRLRLGGNSLTGSIPPTINLLSRLTYLELDGNHLDAEIPPLLGRCTNLTLLNLASNRLRGELPKELGALQQLVVMKLQMNNLSGKIPNELFELVNLITLNLSWNSLTGGIPPQVSSLQKLSVLNLEYNDLTGPLPDTVVSLEVLIELQLGHNQLNGTVPIMPTRLGTALNLSSNQFSGPIPSYLAALSTLEILDLSNNSFTGEVPSSLTQMNGLTQLVLSNNQLSGVLPQFPHWVIVNATGNDFLVETTESPSESPSISSKKKNSRVLYIIVAIVSAFVGFGFVAVFLLVLVSKRFYRVEDEGLRSEENPLQVINGCFLTASSIHSSSIDFSKAMEAVGNPGNIALKTRFSTYYKAAMPSGVCYTVKKLNWSNKIFQTGSHGRFRKELEVLGRISSSNVMVPLAYVLTEDSAYLFYEHVHKGTVFDFLHKGSVNALDWPSRYSIALGIAQGLAFLHGCTQPVLLLDLTTKSIHLKSMKEPQIGDIELCKVIDPSKSTGSLSTVAGSVGYVPPEYAYTMRVTTAGNVYSFGVILLELLTGKPPVSEGIELAKRVLSYSARMNERERILDHRISKTSLAVRSQMMSVFKVALECVSPSPDARPKTRNVLRMLFNAR